MSNADLGLGSKSVRERKGAMSMDEQMKMEHVCKSGNRAGIHLPENAVPAEFQLFQVEWDSFPPSSEDLREYHEEVYAEQIVPLQLRRLEKETGKKYRTFPFAPGLYAFKPVMPVGGNEWCDTPIGKQEEEPVISPPEPGESRSSSKN